MKIALVQDWMTGFAGGEQVLLALHEMYPDAPIYTSLYNPKKIPQFDKATVIPSYLQKIPGLIHKDKLSIPLFPAAFESFDLKGFDVVISVGGGFSKGVITHPHQRHISYCHTPIRYIWRLGGDTRNEGKWDSWLRNAVAHKMRLWDVVSAERVDEFIGNSQTVVGRIEKIYRQKAQVIYPPVDISNYTVSTTSEDFFLAVGRLVSYKQTKLLIEACIQGKKPLKVIGTGPELATYQAMVKDAPWVEILGRVSDADRDALYAKTKAFLFAAEEDFGIVPVEAMACGKPVIAYGKGGVTETVTAGVSGIFFEEQTVESVLKAFETFATATFDPQAIRASAERFTKTIFQEKMRNLIEFQS